MNKKKKILFVCQYFYPEVFRGNDIAFHWAEEGHDVHVVTGIPNYPDGVFHDGYGLLKNVMRWWTACVLLDSRYFLVATIRLC